MKISVIVPIYNEAKNIKECLNSLVNQTRPADEILVIDNNSTDESVNIVKSFANIRCISEKKQGISYARDAGFKAASGDIVARIDADSIAPPEWLDRVEKNFEDPNLNGLSGPVIFKEFPWKILSSTPSLIYLIIGKLITGFDLLVGPNMAIRKSAWEKTSPCHSDLYLEDLDLAYHLHPAGRLFIDPKMWVYSSARRMYLTPKKFFIDYPWMFSRTKKEHTIES